MNGVPSISHGPSQAAAAAAASSVANIGGHQGFSAHRGSSHFGTGTQDVNGTTVYNVALRNRDCDADQRELVFVSSQRRPNYRHELEVVFSIAKMNLMLRSHDGLQKYKTLADFQADWKFYGQQLTAMEGIRSHTLTSTVAVFAVAKRIRVWNYWQSVKARVPVTEGSKLWLLLVKLPNQSVQLMDPRLLQRSTVDPRNNGGAEGRGRGGDGDDEKDAAVMDDEPEPDDDLVWQIIPWHGLDASPPAEAYNGLNWEGAAYFVGTVHSVIPPSRKGSNNFRPNQAKKSLALVNSGVETVEAAREAQSFMPELEVMLRY